MIGQETHKVTATTHNGDELELVTSEARAQMWEREPFRPASNVKSVWVTPLDRTDWLG